MLQPTGIRTGSLLRLLKLSQYRRAEEAAAFGTQYSMMSSNISSRVSAFSGFPWQSVHALNFSRIQADASRRSRAERLGKKTPRAFEYARNPYSPWYLPIPEFPTPPN